MGTTRVAMGDDAEGVALVEKKMHGWGQFAGFAPGSAEFMIEGANSQVLTVMVPPNQQLVSEPGMYMFMSNGIKVGAECAPGWFKRCCCMMESCFQTVFDNEGPDKQFVGLTPNFPAKVVAMDLKQTGP